MSQVVLRQQRRKHQKKDKRRCFRVYLSTSDIENAGLIYRKYCKYMVIMQT